MRQRARDAVLVIGFPSVSGGIATRLIALGYRPISVNDPPAAAARLCRELTPVRAAIVPTDAPFLTPGALWRLTRATGRDSLRCLALGPRPDDAGLENLRRAGVQTTLFEPCTDRELRFAVNRAQHDDTRGQNRLHPRAAADLVARIRLGTREKAGLVYSLSSVGCYVETDRPCLPGSLVSIHIPLPGCGVEVPARVTFSNVPGDFERKNLPHGMALEFLELGLPDEAALARYVDAKLGEQGIVPLADRIAATSSMARVWSRLCALIGPQRAGVTN